jgi:ATP-binding cassette subfamily B protein
MVARYFGRFYSLEYLRKLTNQRREGVSLLDISEAAERIGMHTVAARLSLEQLRDNTPLPSILHWRDNHFVVLIRFTRKEAVIADPAVGIRHIPREEFIRQWYRNDPGEEPGGIALFLEPTPDFFAQPGEQSGKGSFRYVLQYLLRHRALVWQLGIGLALSVVLMLVFPFLLMALVDNGIGGGNFDFLMLVLGAWLVLYGSQILIEHLRGWIMLHLGVRASISLVSDFLMKVVRLPVRFFDQRMSADLLNRIYDNNRIERLLTTNTLQTVFSLTSILLLGLLLLYFDTTLFYIFLFGTVIYVVWVLRFMTARRELDYMRYDEAARSQERLTELIQGMQDIKLYQAETPKRWDWERAEARQFRTGIKFLGLNQRQRLGASILHELKNIFITVFAVRAVMMGQLSIGGLFAVQYILGQISAPIQQLIDFLRALQDARISLERLNEVHLREDEEDPDTKISILPEQGDLHLENVSFYYDPGAEVEPALKNINLTIPKGKTTAIVGSSGSGKTTLIKLLLQIYEPSEGQIRVGDTLLSNIQTRLWRSKCSAVLQEGFIFSDTIARNIGLGDDIIDDRRLLRAVKVANIQSFVESLPLSYGTRIGANGMGLSQGQKQRLLIARAVYHNPEYFFFDEATNALDAYNEMIIMENLEDYFLHKTRVIVAHRLSTIVNADHIIVLEGGEVVEQGTHEQLSKRKGTYFQLLRNQWELGA